MVIHNKLRQTGFNLCSQLPVINLSGSQHCRLHLQYREHHASYIRDNMVTSANRRAVGVVCQKLASAFKY